MQCVLLSVHERTSMHALLLSSIITNVWKCVGHFVQTPQRDCGVKRQCEHEHGATDWGIVARSRMSPCMPVVNTEFTLHALFACCGEYCATTERPPRSHTH